MKRIAAIILAALVVGAPASAQAPAPTLLRFDAGDPPGAFTTTLVDGVGCPGQTVFESFEPVSAPTFLYATCRSTLRLTFPAPQASVQVMAKALVGVGTRLDAWARTANGALVDEATVRDPVGWVPVSLASPDGTASIASVELRAEGASLGVDDLALSTRPQPDTAVLGGPEPRTEATQARFTFGANRPDVAEWRCSLDGGAFSTCASPEVISNLTPGRHTFRVATVDRYGGVDASPAEFTWTVLGPPPETPIPTGAQPVVGPGGVTLDLGETGGALECSVDGGAFTPCRSPVSLTGLAPGPHTLAVRSVDEDGRPDPTPARWSFDVPGKPASFPDSPVFPVAVADVDRDRIPDTQEVLPLGNVPPVAGERGIATLISGTVYVKLPSNLRQLSGFVPLKGVAALPVGTIVDARRGTIGLDTAADGRAASDPRRRLSRSRLSAAIFQIRQRRARLRTRAVVTQLVLVTPPAADIGCRRVPPAKGIVRSLRATAKGLVRVSGGGSYGVGRNATWRTVDRCGSTTTTVTRGIVRVFDKARGRTVTVRAGRRYVVKAKLFRARKGLRPV